MIKMIQKTHRKVQQQTLPGEITDGIIDFLHNDARALSTCSAVCSTWLLRSRYHSFSTIQLWPWRAQRFFELAQSLHCTFTQVISRLEVDDARERGRELGRGSRAKDDDEHASCHFNDAMSQSHIQCLAQVTTIQIRNVDWTTFSPSEQIRLRGHLSRFSQLRRLEFESVVFHDLRELARIVNSFPVLTHLTVNIEFLKYPELTLASAAIMELSKSLRTVEIGTDDVIPVVLSCITNDPMPNDDILGMKLQNVKGKHLQYIHTMFKKSGEKLQDLSLGFAHENVPSAAQDLLVQTLDLSNLSALRTLKMEGFRITRCNQSTIVNAILPEALRRVESPFFEFVELRFHLEDDADIKAVDWSRLQNILSEFLFFGMRGVRVVIELGSRSLRKEASVDEWIRESMTKLVEQGALDLRTMRENSVETNAMYLDKPFT